MIHRGKKSFMSDSFILDIRHKLSYQYAQFPNLTLIESFVVILRA